MDPSMTLKKSIKREASIGLALGGGGARGLAHLLMLEVFDELGIPIKSIAGTSIGAIIAALYATGRKAKQIRADIDAYLLSENDFFKKKSGKRHLFRSMKFFDFDFTGTGLIKGKNFSRFLQEFLEVDCFEKLSLPLTIVSTNFWDSSQVIFRKGPLLPAIQASMSVPGLFSPVQFNGKILIDGACVNPVPWDLLDDCDVIIAVNTLGVTNFSQNSQKAPKALKAILETFDILQRGILSEKNRHSPPALLLEPPIHGVGLLEFHKAETVYQQSQETVKELRYFLEERQRSKDKLGQSQDSPHTSKNQNPLFAR